MKKSHEEYLRLAIQVSRNAVANGNLPFGAILVDAGGNVIMEQENIDRTAKKCTAHAETQLAERASHMYDRGFLWNCTMYTTAEPCCMCTGAAYWSNIGTIVYAMSEQRLLALTGDNPENPTFNLPCRDVLSKGQKDITVIGPFPELEDEVAEVHSGVWR